MIVCASVCNAQEHTAKVVEVLPNDQFIVDIGGKHYLAINDDKTIELAKMKAELVVCKENEKRFTDKIALADANTKIAEQQRDNERIRFAGALALYEKERELRIESQQFIPHGKVGGIGGKIFNFLDGPYGQSLFKLVIPTASFIKVMQQ